MNFFKPRFVAFLLLIILAGACQKQHTLPEPALQIISQVKEEVCPDSRVSVFKVDGYRTGRKLILKGDILSPVAKKKLLTKLTENLKYEIIDSIQVLPEPSLGADTCGIIRVSVAQVRRNPDVDQEIITQGLMGTPVRLLKKRGGWYFIQLEDQYLGWMMRNSIAVGNRNFRDQWDNSKKLIVIKNYGQIWKLPAENSEPICDVVLGNELLFDQKKNGFYLVILPDGRRGYIKSELVLLKNDFVQNQQPTPENLIRTAKTFLGIPYFWGGKSTKGFDCSGFTQTIFKLNGIQLPRDANMQVKIGREILLDDSLSQVLPGDLLFFGRAKDKITHVALYLGKGKFIHADGIVHVNSLFPQDEDYSDYRRKHLQVAKRILQ